MGHRPKRKAEVKAAIRRVLAEIDEEREHMRRDQAEIDRLKAETRVLRDETRATLDSTWAMRRSPERRPAA